jgi:hypothetical protein
LIFLPIDAWDVLTQQVALQKARRVLPPTHTEITTSYASHLTDFKLSFTPYADAFRHEEDLLVSNASDTPLTRVRGFKSSIVIPSPPSRSSSLPKAITLMEKTWFVYRQDALIIAAYSRAEHAFQFIAPGPGKAGIPPVFIHGIFYFDHGDSGKSVIAATGNEYFNISLKQSYFIS